MAQSETCEIQTEVQEFRSWRTGGTAWVLGVQKYSTKSQKWDTSQKRVQVPKIGVAVTQDVTVVFIHGGRIFELDITCDCRESCPQSCKLGPLLFEDWITDKEVLAVIYSTGTQCGIMGECQYTVHSCLKLAALPGLVHNGWVLLKVVECIEKPSYWCIAEGWQVGRKLDIMCRDPVCKLRCCMGYDKVGHAALDVVLEKTLQFNISWLCNPSTCFQHLNVSIQRLQGRLN